jgi:hypothetical protein
MHLGLDHEEWALTQAIIAHYAKALAEARDKCTDLQRRLDCANERMALLECSIYGTSFL